METPAGTIPKHSLNLRQTIFFYVERVLDARDRDGVREYLVKWEGYDADEDNSWEPASSFDKCPEVRRHCEGGSHSHTRHPRAAAARLSRQAGGHATMRARARAAWRGARR